MKLPAIADKAMPRPGGGEHLVPNPEYAEFWSAFYAFFQKHFSLNEPFAHFHDRVNPYFGNFGMRYQATSARAGYFHLGLDASARARTTIHSIASGLLEYSGFGHINGNYVFLSHPDIQTEDEFTLHSLYLHMRTLDVGFNSYQKMLRKMSFNKYPNIPIPVGTALGGAGSTGNIEGLHPHLHLQLEFRNEAGTIIVVDPAPLFGFAPLRNLTADISTPEAFKEFYKSHEVDIKKSGVAGYWSV